MSIPSLAPSTTDRLYQIASKELTGQQEPGTELSAIPQADRNFLLDNKAWVLDFLNTALPDGYAVRVVESYWFVNPGSPLYKYFELVTPKGDKLFTLEYRRLELLWHERQTGEALQQAIARHQERNRRSQVAQQAAADVQQFNLTLAGKVEALVKSTDLTAEQIGDIEDVRRTATRGGLKSYNDLDLWDLAKIARYLGATIQDL